MCINVVELFPYKKYIQSYIRQPIHGRRPVKGVFKEKRTGKIVTGDDFDCIVFGKESAEECYKAAIGYFNHTLQPGESEREFVSAEWGKEPAHYGCTAHRTDSKGW